MQPVVPPHRLHHPRGSADQMSAAAPLLLLGAATVGVVHSALPDHWAPIAVVGRTQRWSLGRVARVSFLAAGGHVLTSLVLAGVIALVGLQFQRQIEGQQGHIVGGVLALTGVGFLLWGLSGRGHAHDHAWHNHDADDHATEAGHQDDDHHEPSSTATLPHELEPHQHEHAGSAVVAPEGSHLHEHVHGRSKHSHRHNHQAFIRHRAHLIATRSAEQTLAGTLAAIIVPFGVAASPDLTFLPVAAAASAYGPSLVVSVIAVFTVFTTATFVGLTVIATAAGYHLKGEWLENNANTITSVVLIVIGVVAFIGL